MFTWNHQALRREAVRSWARRPDPELGLPSAESPPRQPARTLGWACLLIVLVLVWCGGEGTHSHDWTLCFIRQETHPQGYTICARGASAGPPW
jgi:hypothetical protein